MCCAHSVALPAYFHLQPPLMYRSPFGRLIMVPEGHGVASIVGVTVSVAVGLGVGVSVARGVSVGVGKAVSVGRGLGVAVGVAVIVGSGVLGGTQPAASIVRTTKKRWSIYVSLLRLVTDV